VASCEWVAARRMDARGAAVYHGGMQDTCVVELRAVAWDVELTEPFGIATGVQTRACNVLVEVRLADGTRGLGEAAPFPAVSGETQAAVLDAIEDMRETLLGQHASRMRWLAAALRERSAAVPSARAGVESALLDALCRRLRLPMQRWFGGWEDHLRTDITIVTGSAHSAAAAASRAVAQGFDTLKVKVGGASLDHDRARVEAIRAVAPAARLVLDANASLEPAEAIELVDAIGPSTIALFEQPVAALDLEGLRRVRERAGVRVAADESARTAADVYALASHAAADVINIKITKSGVVEACDMIAAARAAGLGLMIGGMVETPLAMMVSACLAAGHGGFEFVDLDTPLFMRDPPVDGWMQHGPAIDLQSIEAGHGITIRSGRVGT
jgi:L-Ala-D/L-Glu epimerase